MMMSCTLCPPSAEREGTFPDEEGTEIYVGHHPFHQRASEGTFPDEEGTEIKDQRQIVTKHAM